jgi:ATP-dependent DNA helicase RecG
LNSGIEYLKGVGPSRAELLQKELGIFKFRDLLEHYPTRYVDRTKIYRISELNADLPFVQLKGKIISFKEGGQGRGKFLKANFADGTGVIELIWFKGISWLKKSLQLQHTYMLFGKIGSFKGHLSIAHPELDSEEQLAQQQGFQAVYPLTDKLRQRKIDSRTIRKLVFELFTHPNFLLHEVLPDWILKDMDLIDRKLAYQWIHAPSNNSELQMARKRLKFEEFFLLQAGVMHAKMRRQVRNGLLFDVVGKHFHKFYDEYLDFELTNAQKRVIREIREDFRSGKQMNRLLQGDVGSGKSIVALLCMLIAADNGFQTSLMAPTEILASQHYQSFAGPLEQIGLKAALLTGSTKASDRKRIFEELETGEIALLIGTHALIEDPVQLKNQGLVIIDEQHRFGVAQRARLWQKSKYYPHVLVMTATPIPRTLAMTVYGELDVSKIDEMPKGRKTIITAHRKDRNRLAVMGFLKEEIKKGRQVYMVYPLIEESEKLDYKNLEEGYDHLLHFFPRPEYQIQMMHGRMKADEKEDAMQRFKRGEIDIMVSTTVIEVGINVPNATVMVIESAEKFGLAQLHQLRGRVGRGTEQSYCILMSGEKVSKDGLKRLQAMVKSADGFEIAEMDLKLRGPGDIEGTQQSGLTLLKIASIVQDEQLLFQSKNCIEKLMGFDSELQMPQHSKLKAHLSNSKIYKDWGSIS